MANHEFFTESHYLFYFKSFTSFQTDSLQIKYKKNVNLIRSQEVQVNYNDTFYFTHRDKMNKFKVFPRKI